MSSTTRQNNLILNEDWKRIYQTFKNADFKSYDFENLRRVIITYLRENYPEDFNDYIESSEYLALIDTIAFLGQSLSFRIDLTSRENFIELAERKESVLRLARMLSYNAKRNVAASGLLKFSTISTTENILDGSGKDLSNQIISWNDPTNSNWLEQFITILNSAMADNVEFGRSEGSATIQGILTEQYRFRTNSEDVPVFSFTKTVASRSMVFEVLSTGISNDERIVEESPTPQNQLGFVYRNDGKGPGSSNTGFYLVFKQGSLEQAQFTIDIPTVNEIISIDANNINNDDVWLFSLDASGQQIEQWTQVSNLIGNNIAYNSISQNIRNIFSVLTKEDDKVDLLFSDGVYGNLPRGSFRVYYRVSNGLSYTISPVEMKGINISLPYINKKGERHTVKISLSLQSTVTTASATEGIDSIRANAPALYYTQNRMITGEDYNLAPLSSSQDILKVKSINRSSSGISRNFEIIDASGKYSSVNVFADDGYMYKAENEKTLSAKFVSRLDILNFIRKQLEPIFTSTEVYNFYITKFDKIFFTDRNVIWQSVTDELNRNTGYFKNTIGNEILKVGSFSTSVLQYVLTDSLIKFTPPAGKAFKKGKIVDIDVNDSDQVDRLWTKIIRVNGDGTASGEGILNSGLGPVAVTDSIPSGAIATRIIPKFVNDLPTSLELEILNQANQNLNFGLRYDVSTLTWKIITASNLDLTGDFSLGQAGIVNNLNQDNSWIIAFVKEPDSYTVRIRILDYIFGSVEQNRFYLDSNKKRFNDATGRVIVDQIKVLGINTDFNFLNQLKTDLVFEANDTVKFDDGYESSQEIKIAFSDRDADGVIDNPESFEMIVGEDADNNYLFFLESVDESGYSVLTLVDNSNDLILIEERESAITLTDYNDGQLIYFYDVDEDWIKSVDLENNRLVLQTQYKAFVGRTKLKFQYIHNASEDRRIDPSTSNIVDVYLLSRSYDTAYRTFLSGGTNTEPEVPTTEDLRLTYGTKLDSIKAISDEIVYHPVRYKVLFGSQAPEKLRAQFKVVKNPNKTINDNDLKVRIISSINEFFDVNNWDFGDRFYLGELITHITNAAAPDISNLVIVPTQPGQSFGSLFEIQSGPDELLVSGATVDDILIVSAITAYEVKADSNSIVTTT